MNSEPLSLSRPARGTGNRLRISCTPPRTRAWPLPHKACSSIQLVATSTAQRVKRKKPRVVPPQWATRSTSRKPGRASFHSVKVRIGICCLSQVLGRVVVAPAQRVAGARGRQQASEGWPAGLAEQFVEGGVWGELAALDEPIE